MTADTDAPSTEQSRFRALSGASRRLAMIMVGALAASGALWALEVPYHLGFTVFREQFLGFILGLALGATFLMARVHGGERGDGVPWYDWGLAAAGVAVGAFIALMYPKIAYDLGVIRPERWVLGGVALLLILEATRRLLGLTLIFLALACLAYAKFGDIFPGLFYAKGVSWERLASYVYLDANGILGITLAVTATTVIAFILFGQMLYTVRGDRFFTDIASAMFGRARGGTAKMAVVSSSLFGTVSGSAVSNVVISGSVTIPMMVRARYPRPMAAAVEAVASTGGQIMPPVMGVAAFIMAEYLSVPYYAVVLAALIPAVLYYVSLFIQIDLEAAKHGFARLPESEIPTLGAAFREGWVFLIPLGVLLYGLLVAHWPAGKAGTIATLTCLVVAYVFGRHRPSAAELWATLTRTGQGLLYLVVLGALAGIVIGSLQLSGMTFKLGLILTDVAGASSLLLLALTAVVCIVLGLGMPTTVIYVMLAVLVAPALVQLGIDKFAAHMFIFYFGMLSMITPPVCIATYTAASLAEANMWKAGWMGARLGVVAYIVPFFFAFHPALLAQGSGVDIAIAVVSAVAGVGFLSIGAVGFLFRAVGWPLRVVFVACGGLLIGPASTTLWAAANAGGLIVGLGLLAALWTTRPRAVTDVPPRES